MFECFKKFHQLYPDYLADKNHVLTFSSLLFGALKENFIKKGPAHKQCWPLNTR